MSRFKIQRKEEKVRAKKRNRLAMLVVLFLLSPFILGSGWLWYQLNALGKAGSVVTIEIAKGSGVREIGAVLEENNVVRSGAAFSVYSKLARRGPYQAGKYEIATNIDAGQAASVLEKGPKINYDKFTIIPGQRLVDVQNNAAQLPGMSEKGFQEALSSGKFVSRYSPDGNTSLEGLLLPETYSIATTETEEDIIRRSLQEFDARARSNGLEGSVNGYTPYQIITIASMIEKEARYSDDRPIIASVIYNRLAIDMPLQIDATVIYGLGRSSGSPSSSELKQDTPFNTYIHKGLIPSPISMISMDSLRAALNPATTDYLYYVLMDADTGKHAFAKTFEEHNQNIRTAQNNGAL